MNLAAKLSLTMAILASLGCSVQAAVLVPNGSKLVVNHGAGYVPYSGGELSPGDQVMARSGNSGLIDYGNGCRIAVKRGSIATIADGVPCKLDVQKLPQEPAVVGGGFDPTLYIAGGLVTAAIIVGIVIANNDDKKTSP